MQAEGEITITGIERVPAHDGISNFYTIQFHVWLPGEVDERVRSNLTGGVRSDIPWTASPEEFEAEARKAVARFVRQAADRLAPAD
jgi:hypothetical protein